MFMFDINAIYIDDIFIIANICFFKLIDSSLSIIYMFLIKSIEKYRSSELIMQNFTGTF